MKESIKDIWVTVVESNPKHQETNELIMRMMREEQLHSNHLHYCISKFSSSLSQRLKTDGGIHKFAQKRKDKLFS